MSLNKYKKIFYIINRFVKILFFSIFYYRQVNSLNEDYKKEIIKLKKKNKKIKKENYFLKKKIKKKEKLINKILKKTY
jgi:cell division protein FtsB